MTTAHPRLIAPIKIRPAKVERALRALMLALSIFSLGPGAGFAAQRVTVEMFGGRRLQGTVSRRTDEKRLWIALVAERIEIETPLAWSRVAAVVAPERRFTSAEFREGYLAWRAQASASALAAEPLDDLLATASPEPPAAYRQFLPLSTVVESPRSEPERLPRVASIAVDAWVANWDRDLEVDGIAAWLQPLDAMGAPTLAAGSVEFDLRGFQTGATNADAMFPRIARWVKRVDPEQATSRGQAFQLPFQAVHPEFRSELSSYGVLEVRLSVPGQGTFAAVIDWLRIRPFSPQRDRLQRLEGTRILPGERPGRTQ